MTANAACYPAGAMSDHDRAVEAIDDLLAQAIRGEYVAWALSEVMASVDRRSRAKNRTRLSAGQFSRLSAKATQASLAAVEFLPPSYSRSQIAVGMQALHSQIAIWAEPAERTRQRDTLFEIDAHARMLRNDLHNMSLAEMLQERAARRRGEPTGMIVLKAIARCA